MHLHNQPESFNFAESFSFDNIRQNIKNHRNEIGLFEDSREIEYIYFTGNDNPQKFCVTIQYQNSDKIELCDIRQIAYILFGEAYIFTLSTVYSLFGIMSEKLEIQQTDAQTEKQIKDFVNDILKMSIIQSFYFDATEENFYILGTEIMPFVDQVIDITPTQNYFSNAMKQAENDGFDVETIANI